MTTEASCYNEGTEWYHGYNFWKIEVNGEPVGAEFSYPGMLCAEHGTEAPEKWWCFDPRWEDPEAACCIPDGTCLLIPWSECRDTEGAHFWGYGTDCAPNPCPQLETEFIRGDVNADDVLSTEDLLYFMAAIIMPDPPCWDAADFDDDGDADLDDALGLLGFLFDQGSPPPPPHPAVAWTQLRTTKVA